MKTVVVKTISRASGNAIDQLAVVARRGNGARSGDPGTAAPGDGDAADALDALADRLALEQLHGEVEVSAFALAEIEDGDRVGRREKAVGSRLA